MSNQCIQLSTLLLAAAALLPQLLQPASGTGAEQHNLGKGHAQLSNTGSHMTEPAPSHRQRGLAVPHFVDSCLSVELECLPLDVSQSVLNGSRDSTDGADTHPVLLDAWPCKSYQVSAKTSYRPQCPHPLSP